MPASPVLPLLSTQAPYSQSVPEACALESVQHCADWLSIWATFFFFFFAVSHKAAERVERPHNQKVMRPEPYSLGSATN